MENTWPLNKCQKPCNLFLTQSNIEKERSECNELEIIVSFTRKYFFSEFTTSSSRSPKFVFNT